jgi:hypothetical protein
MLAGSLLAKCWFRTASSHSRTDVNAPSELIRHVKVLEAQVERDSDLDRRFDRSQRR